MSLRGVQERYSPDGLQSNALQRRFAPGGLDEPLVWLEGTGTSNRKWHLADERGSVIALANATAGVTAINRYDPFGVQPAGGANTGRFRYAGSPWIGSAGLHHMRARTYHAENGRFMQPDSIRFGDDPNLYAYVANDPVNFVDPLGLWAVRIGWSAKGGWWGFGGFGGGVYIGTRQNGSLTFGFYRSRSFGLGQGLDLSVGGFFCPACSVLNLSGLSFSASGKRLFGIEASIPYDQFGAPMFENIGFGLSFGLSLDWAVTYDYTQLGDYPFGLVDELPPDSSADGVTTGLGGNSFSGRGAFSPRFRPVPSALYNGGLTYTTKSFRVTIGDVSTFFGVCNICSK